MTKCLIIAAVGDDSLHHYWISKNASFDLGLIYYGSNAINSEAYKRQCKFFLEEKGHKFHLIYKFFELNSEEIISNYEWIWMPDDDLQIKYYEIEKLFNYGLKYKLQLYQPSMKGYISHSITKRKRFFDVRFTNFVEVLAPLMNIDTFLILKETFKINESGWGLEFLWNKLLMYPKNKIAIIDSVSVIHTKPIGINYSRFKTIPKEELRIINTTYNLGLNLDNFKKNFVTYKRVFKSLQFS